MASSYVSKKKAAKKAEKERRKQMTARQSYAIENARLRATEGDSSPMKDKKSVPYSHTTDQLVGGKIQGTEVDASFAADIQKMKFCRKPVGFVMWLLYIILLVALAAPFVLPKLNLDLGIDLDQYLSLCMETEAKTTTTTDAGNAESVDETADEDEGAENASGAKVLAADEENSEEAEGEEESDEESGDAATAVASTKGTYHNLSDPLFGWIEYVAGKANLSLELGDSAWYDEQISKTEVMMNDKVASILILAFPPFIIVYILLTLVLMVQVFICFASGDRRIFRFTSIENLILLLSGAIIMLGCFAATTEINATMDFGGIATFLLGGVTGAGGFTAGYGMLAMLGLPLIEFILSFFLLEKKLRGREITQPIVVYHYKEK